MLKKAGFSLLLSMSMLNAKDVTTPSIQANAELLPPIELISQSLDVIVGDGSQYDHQLIQELYGHPWINTSFENQLEALSEFEKEHGYFSDSKSLVSKVTSADEDIKKVQNILISIALEVKEPRQRLFTTGEVLTKVLAYRDLKVGMEIIIPTINRFGNPTVTLYRVDHLFDLWQQMPAFGLVPVDANDVAPILLFRGTDATLKTKRGWASLISDLDFGGPGYSVFHNAREEIRNWLAAAAEKGIKARVMGFSLGGILTSYTVCYEPELINLELHESSMAFNPPGVTRKVARKWDQMSEDNRPPLVVFITNKDFVPKLGRQIGEVYQITPTSSLNPLSAHVTLMSAETIAHLLKIDSSSYERN